MGVLKFPKLGLTQLWRPITLCADLWVMWCLKQRFSPCRELSNSMWHATFTQGSQGDFRLLMVGSQIDNLTHDPSFGYNLCFNHPNESCEPIVNIYIPIVFQWYKELFNLMGFDPCNHSLKIQESIGTLSPKVGAHLRVWKVYSLILPTLSHTPTLPRTWNLTLRLHS
jgi:hypothetical protein